MQNNLVSEANRCLKCKVPRCQKGCPVNTNIKEMIQMFLDKDILNAGKMLFDNNPLTLICSLVCPHERQCEGNCVLGIKGDSVNISSIENYISDYYLKFVESSCEKNREKKIAIIGSGPAGITIAFILASRGYDITIFEAHDRIGGVLMYGIPEFRLPKAILVRLKDKMLELGIKIRPNTLIGPVLTIDDLFRDGYKAVFIGTGVWKPKSLGIKGESLGHVHYAIDYLKNPDVYTLGDKLCIIGAGNVAIDVARTALRKGVREVYILYRGGMEDITAEKHEVEYAKIDGVKFELFKTPIEIVDQGVIYSSTIKSIDEYGTENFTTVENTENLFEADSVIISISQGPRANIVTTTKGIAIGNNGLVSTDETGKTTREGVFASGDVVTGAKTVVEAVRLSKQVADVIDKYVMEKLK
ncbi:NAD(P)-dependent oxidoreductase [Clostridium grantii]|uniref:Glutamate synthase (NADPH/NADH) small chain n=1 Tax=Clostridium grantii DSM 8605 TaxID=1121316 RepID=A0A1M5QZ34_9CLOT|nr:NAD(P)-dependent oxidoreductase [Clostridium grantii]SHH19395.1 glutamate synthase (NADPH/NADH) small chain [Clostridium grantii DSM 8605]